MQLINSALGYANCFWEQYSKDTKGRASMCIAGQQLLCWVCGFFWCCWLKKKLRYRDVILLSEVLSHFKDTAHGWLRPSMYDTKKSCEGVKY